tara:strand:+ start:360 stop:824 length:465 start_codon:yes stop_codon:yes gene_type:complete
MASTISSATLTVTITEAVSLNGSAQGATNTLSIASINEIFKRIVTCTASQTTTVLTFNADVHGAAGAIDLQDAKYIRITNKDDTNALELAVVGAATLYQVELAAGESHILGNPDALMLAEEDTSPSFGTMANLGSIQVNPGGNAIDVEVFVASA